MEYLNDLLTLSEISTYLKLSEKTVLKMVKNNEIPCAKIANQWRFLKPLIDDWILSQMQVIPQNDLSKIVQQESDRIPITRLTGRDLITIFPSGTSKEQALKILTDVAQQQGVITNSDKVLKKLIEREQMLSTGIGSGFAIPHMRKPTSLVVNGPRIIIGAAPQGIEFDAADKQPVNVLFLLLSDSEVVHIRLLALITRMLQKKETAEVLKKSANVNSLFTHLAEYDRSTILQKEL